MTLGDKTVGSICDLCGREKSFYNQSCPQHRMWLFERERDAAREEIERLRGELSHRQSFEACIHCEENVRLKAEIERLKRDHEVRDMEVKALAEVMQEKAEGEREAREAAIRFALTIWGEPNCFPTVWLKEYPWLEEE